MFVGPQLVFDPVAQRADLAFDGTDLVLDLTPATALMVAIGSDRRAHPDDELPDTGGTDDAPWRLNARRGSPCDAVNPAGKLTGSRLWLLKRRKQDEQTRRLAEGAAAEATADFEAIWNLPVSITVRWVMRGMLGLLVKLGPRTMNITVPVGG